MYPEVEKYLSKDKFYIEFYKTPILNIINGFYKQLSADKEMHSWCRCKDNRYEDLYDAFIEKVENLMPTFNDAHDDNFRIYNFLHDDDFYNIWTNDVLRLLIKMKRGGNI